MTPDQRLRMLDRLVELGVRRITVTGGEPMILKDHLFEFLQGCRERGLHTSLSTTGHGIGLQALERLDEHLDHLLISIRSLDLAGWREDFGSSDATTTLFESVTDLLRLIRRTGIILEVSTVLHRRNIEAVTRLGVELAHINPHLIWRIEDYYAMGIYADDSALYEIDPETSRAVKQDILERFHGVFDHIYLSQRNRDVAPDFMITPSGGLVRTAGNRYSRVEHSILDPPPGLRLENRRPWSDYLRYCRNWTKATTMDNHSEGIEVFGDAHKVDWTDVIANATSLIQIVVNYWPDWLWRHEKSFRTFLEKDKTAVHLITPDPDDEAACEQVLVRFPMNGHWIHIREKVRYTAQALDDSADDGERQRITWIRLAQMPPFAAVRVDNRLYIAHYDMRFTPYKGATPMVSHSLDEGTVWGTYWEGLNQRLGSARTDLSFFPGCDVAQRRALLRQFHKLLDIQWTALLEIGSPKWRRLREWMRFAALVERQLISRGQSQQLVNHRLTVSQADGKWLWTWRAPSRQQPSVFEVQFADASLEWSAELPDNTLAITAANCARAVCDFLTFEQASSGPGLDGKASEPRA